MPPRDERETETGTRDPARPSSAPLGPGPGDLLAGTYRIDRVLGRGGMGVVFEATDVRLDRTVALKTLALGAQASPEQRARFEREARALARLESNEHVARVLWFGEIEGGAALMVMEHLVGRDLRHELRSRGALEQADAVLYTLHVCDALADAHAAGIIHRDLKPSNLFLTRDRNAAPLLKVLDFGVTKSPLLREGEMATASHTFLGSLPFVSPEQLKSTKDADARSDVWSLGVTLYEMLTGRLPFEGRTNADLAIAIDSHRPAPPSRLRPDLSPGLDAVVLACLEKDPSQRTPHMAALARALLPFAPEAMEACVASIERRSGIAPVREGRGVPVRRAPAPVHVPEPSEQGLSQSSGSLVIPGEKASSRALARWSLVGGAVVLAGILAAMVLGQPSAAPGAGVAAVVNAAHAGAAPTSPDSPAPSTMVPSSPSPLLPSPPALAPSSQLPARAVDPAPPSPLQTSTPVASRPPSRSAATAIDPASQQPSSPVPAGLPAPVTATDSPASTSAPVAAAAAPSAPSPPGTPPRAPPILDVTGPPDIVR